MFRTRCRVVNRVVLLPQERIVAAAMQPRQCFDERAIEELAASIAANGLLQPITVRLREDGCYELIAGERRLRACRRLGMEGIPAIIEDRDPQQAAVLSLIENLQREDLNCFEEAEALARLQRLGSYSQSELARQLGRSQPAVANKLRLLLLEPAVREAVLQAGLTERHARVLLRLGGEEARLAALRQMVRQEMRVSEAERYVAELLQPPKKPPTRLLVVKDLRLFVNTINKAVATMTQAGIAAESERSEDEEYIRFSIRIPKKSVCRRTTA